jgi:hypothetical protein
MNYIAGTVTNSEISLPTNNLPQGRRDGYVVITFVSK